MNTLASIASIGVGATVVVSCRYYMGFIPSVPWQNASLRYIDFEYYWFFYCRYLSGSYFGKLLLSETYRLMLLVGLTGSLTTMSTLSFESLEMLGGGNYGQALLNILLNIGLSLLAAGLGVMLAKYGFSLAQS